MVLWSMSLPQCNRRMRIWPPRFCTNACAHFIECNGRSPVLGSESPKTELASNMSSTQRPEEIEFQGEGTKCQCFAFLGRSTFRSRRYSDGRFHIQSEPRRCGASACGGRERCTQDRSYGPWSTRHR